LTVDQPNPFTMTYMTLGMLRETLDQIQVHTPSVEIIWAQSLAARLADNLHEAEEASRKKR
jgi:hypothetical protein